MRIKKLYVVVAIMLACGSACKTKQGTQPQSVKPDQVMSAQEEPSPKPSADSYVGMAIAEATRLAGVRGLSSRIVSVDGQLRPVTKDLRPDRLNFSVVDGKVVRVTRG